MEEKKIEEVNPSERPQVVFGRKQFDEIAPLPPVKRWIEGLKGYVYFRQISGKDLEEFETLLTNITENKDGTVEVTQRRDAMRAKWIVVCLCDEKGKTLYKPEEYILLDGLSADVVKEMYDVSEDVNKVTKAGLERARKNSSTGKDTD